MIIASRASAVPILLTLLALTTACTGGNASSSAFPPRPAEIAIAKLDPCTMLDSAQRARLYLGSGTPRTANVNGSPSAACTWTSENGFGYNAQTIPIAAESALTEAGAVTVSINGFGAVQSVVQELTGGAPTCQVTIDAAPGESIRVQARVTPQPPLPSDTEMCRRATAAASMVMTTVVANSR